MVYFNGSSRTAADLPGVPMGTAITSRTISFGLAAAIPTGHQRLPQRPLFSIYFCKMCRIPARKAIKPARPTATRVASFSFQAPSVSIRTARSSAAWASAATAWIRTTTSLPAAPRDSKPPPPSAPINLHQRRPPPLLQIPPQSHFLGLFYHVKLCLPKTDLIRPRLQPPPARLSP